MCGRYTLIVDNIALLEQLQNIFPDKQLNSTLDEDIADISREKNVDNGSKTHKKGYNFINYNVSPSTMMPIIFCPEDNTDTSELQVSLAHWGLIPSWVDEKTPLKKYATFNARLEKVLHNRLWNGAKFRCLVPISGYYEWLKDRDTKGKKSRSKKGPKQPFYVTEMVDEKDIKQEDIKPDTDIKEEAEEGEEERIKQEDEKIKGEDEEDIKEEHDDGYQNVKKENEIEAGPNKLMFLAGLYSYNKQIDQYSFTIITEESQDPLQWLHDRMPCMMNPNNDKQINEWLNPERQKWTQKELDDILSFEEGKKLSIYPVDPRVGNVQNHESDLINPFTDNVSNEQPINVKKEANQTELSPKVTAKRRRSHENVLEMLRPKRKHKKSSSSE